MNECDDDYNEVLQTWNKYNSSSTLVVVRKNE
jgi:hypothetical protein